MNGREEKKANDLFYTCSLIEYMARKTHNRPATIATALGRTTLEKIYDLADIYHSDNIDRVCQDFVEEKQIAEGKFDNVTSCEYAVPSHWDIGKVYKRLILMAVDNEPGNVIDTLLKVYESKVSDLIENYNSSFYYENPQTIYETYRSGGSPE